MGAPRAFNDHHLRKSCFGKRTLRECASRKRDNIVLIEVDSDDFGDVIILDVPESLQKKFKKKSKHVISIDDDDDDDGGKAGDWGSHTSSSDETTSDRGFPTEAADPSTSAYAEEDVNEGNTPVKLSKSKRTYSGKSIPGNRYGLGPDSEGCLSESDCSDCELMEGSSGKLREQWEKASFRKRRDGSCVAPDFKNEAGSSAPRHPVHDSAEDTESPGNGQMEEEMGKFHQQWEKASFRKRRDASCCTPDSKNEAGTSERSHPVHDNAEDTESPVSGQQNYLKKCSLHHEGDNVFAGSPQKCSEESKFVERDDDPMEVDEQSTRTHDDCLSSSFDDKEECGTFVPESSANHSDEHYTVKKSEPNHSAGKHAEQFKSPRQDCDAKRRNEGFSKDYSATVTKESSLNVESNHSALFDRQQGAEITSKLYDQKSLMTSDHKGSYGNELVSSLDQNTIIIDRQKMKETEEYKRAMEEEIAARQQQLLVQAEEARRLRSRKKAENMRIMMNEKRQKERVEEIRQTRRREEENLNLKEKHRVEIKKELHRIEAVCSDMASLLRCLGIHVGGGLYPSPNEVQAAYKRACLKFHPDRMSTTDLRQQVEAEEKFKLISNMKDKF